MMNKRAEYAPSLHEIHHTQKLDAPSGTAIALGEGIIENINKLEKWEATDVDKNAGNGSILPITSARIDDTPGTHIIKYQSLIDEIEIKHTAKSRAGFAQGALMAAEWIIDKKGVFGMTDLLDI